jgi:hypothetical protein
MVEIEFLEVILVKRLLIGVLTLTVEVCSKSIGRLAIIKGIIEFP